MGVRDFAEEPDSLGDDDSIAALLDAAEDIVNAAGPDILSELDAEQGGKKRRRPRMHKKTRTKKRKKGRKR